MPNTRKNMAVTTSFADLPRLLTGADVLLDPDVVEPFGADYLAFRGRPGAVVRPRSTEQVASLLALSAERGFAVVPRAAATNLCGSFLPQPDAVVIDMTSMDRIISIDEESLEAIVEPGVINAALQERLAPLGLCWSPDPASRPISTIGGNISTNAGGPGCIKYGVTFHHVEALEVVLPGGRVVQMRKADPVDLLGVMIGSEGTLGLVTRATLRLRRMPRAAWTALAAFSRIDEAAEAVSAIIAERIGASALELLDRRGVEVIDAWRPSGYPTEPEALLFAEVDGEPAEVDAEASRLLAVLERADPGVRVARTRDERAALWAGRLGFAVAMKVSGKLNFVNDVTVPRQSIPELVKRVRAIAAASRLDVPIVAHAGDGNTHPVILFDEQERDAAFASASEMTDTALDLGGTITGEHGVGSDKLPHMTRRFTQAELASFRAIKRAFDPQGLLNPGVLLPAQSPSEPVDTVLEAVIASALSGAPPQEGGSRIGADTDVHVDEQNLAVEAGAAARCEDVRKMLRARRLHCPAFAGNLTVGATVQSSAARPLVRPSLLAIEAEMDHGTVRFGGAAVKDVAGLDAKRLLCGCGGDSSIVRRVTFRLEPA